MPAEGHRPELTMTEQDHWTALQVLQSGVKAGTLVHFDAHDDLCVELDADGRTKFDEKAFLRIKGELCRGRTGRAWELLSGLDGSARLVGESRVDIATWIIPLVVLGSVQRVVFLRPSWGVPIPAGDSVLCAGFVKGQLRVGQRGRVHPAVRELFDDNGFWSDEPLARAVPWDLSVRELGAPLELHPSEQCIFHVDLDCLGAQNPWVGMLEQYLRQEKLAPRPDQAAHEVFELLTPVPLTAQTRDELGGAVVALLRAETNDDQAPLRRRVQALSAKFRPSAESLLRRIPLSLLTEACRPGRDVGWGFIDALDAVAMPHHVPSGLELAKGIGQLLASYREARRSQHRPIVCLCRSDEYIVLSRDRFRGLLAKLLPPIEEDLGVKFVSFDREVLVPDGPPPQKKRKV